MCLWIGEKIGANDTTINVTTLNVNTSHSIKKDRIEKRGRVWEKEKMELKNSQTDFGFYNKNIVFLLELEEMIYFLPR